MHYPGRRGCLSQSLLPCGKWWQCFLNSMSSKAIFPVNPWYLQQASLAPLLCRWSSAQAAALPSEGAPLRELFCPLPRLGNEERTTGRAGQGRVVPFAGVGQRPGSTSLKEVVLRQVSDRIGEDQSVQGWEVFLLFRQVRVERWGHPLSPVNRSWPQIQGNEYGDTLEKADSWGWGLLPPQRKELGWGPGSHEMPVLTWSLVHSRSQVLWASTHRWGLSWLGHMPGWLPGSGSGLVSEVRWMSPKTKSRGRSGCGAGMGATGPGCGSVWPPATRGARTSYRHPPYRVLGLRLLSLPQMDPLL